jgi:hypothetical protein
VAKYHTQVLEEYKAHLVYDKVDDLCRAVEQGADLNTIVLLYDGLNLLSRRLRKKVEKLLRKLKLGKVPWSPEIQRLMDERKLWSNVVKWRKQIKISKKKIYQQMRRLGITNAFEVTLLEAQQQRNKAQKDWLKAIKIAPDLCKEWLKSLAEARAAKNNTTSNLELKQLKHREKQREEAQRRRNITGKGANKRRQRCIIQK